MSTAFMVDNILHKEDHINDSFSSASDTDSEDHKLDSMCESPSPPFRHHIITHTDTDDLLPSYTVLRDRHDIDDIDDSDGSIAGEQPLCCAKCGHLAVMSPGNSKTPPIDCTGPDFKCDKCGCGDYIAKDATFIAGSKSKDANVNTTTTKPVLKFSVSAILGDRKECVKVRHAGE